MVMYFADTLVFIKITVYETAQDRIFQLKCDSVKHILKSTHFTYKNICFPKVRLNTKCDK